MYARAYLLKHQCSTTLILLAPVSTSLDVHLVHLVPCIGRSVRLVNGSDENEGRVEICSNGVWGTVGGQGGWDSREGTVICRQLGFQNPGFVRMYQNYLSNIC